MPGTKGHSGGARPGAGPKVKTFSLKTGQANLIIHHTQDGQLLDLGLGVTVEIESRNVLVLHLSDGSQLRLWRVQ